MGHDTVLIKVHVSKILFQELYIHITKELLKKCALLQEYNVNQPI